IIFTFIINKYRKLNTQQTSYHATFKQKYYMFSLNDREIEKKINTHSKPSPIKHRTNPKIIIQYIVL
ncbi:TPA: hypothetical protein ACPY2Q_002623, partial [Yersinia enterocolitica]